MRIIDTSVVVDGDAETLWKVWTDVDGWSAWDPHTLEAHLSEGAAFVAGATGFTRPKGAPAGPFTLDVVEPTTRWVSRSDLPLGALVFEHTIEPLADGRCRLTHAATASGPMSLVVQLGWGRRMRADSITTLHALAAQAATLLQ